jgi:hypothetical protein
MLTTSAVNKLKDYIKNIAAFGQYRVGSTNYKVPIHKTEVLGDGKVAIYILIDHTVPGTITVNRVQIFDVGGELWAEKVENITILDMQEGVLVRFTLDLQLL